MKMCLEQTRISADTNSSSASDITVTYQSANLNDTIETQKTNMVCNSQSINNLFDLREELLLLSVTQTNCYI